MIIEDLKALADPAYKAFHAKLLVTIDAARILGVRTPALRRYAKQIKGGKQAQAFLAELPHFYYDENNLHAFLIAEERDFDKLMHTLESFLPYIDNWATCDMLSPKLFQKHADKLLPYVERWLQSEHPYTVRFGIKVLMDHFLEERFELSYPTRVAAVRSKEYYVNMMIAWYFATALAKQYETIVPFFTAQKLETWTHNKALQKAIESRRLTQLQKNYLKTLKRR